MCGGPAARGRPLPPSRAARRGPPARRRVRVERRAAWARALGPRPAVHDRHHGLQVLAWRSEPSTPPHRCSSQRTPPRVRATGTGAVRRRAQRDAARVCSNEASVADASLDHWRWHRAHRQQYQATPPETRRYARQLSLAPSPLRHCLHLPSLHAQYARTIHLRRWHISMLVLWWLLAGMKSRLASISSHSNR